jgi:hypothetical protein
MRPSTSTNLCTGQRRQPWMRDLFCPRHHPRKYSQCGCPLPAPPSKPLPTDTCKWCFGEYRSAYCQRFGHMRMALAEHDAALKFYEKTYGVRVEKPPEPLEKPQATPEMRQYFASLGRLGGRSRSERKKAASRQNLNLWRGNELLGRGSIR